MRRWSNYGNNLGWPSLQGYIFCRHQIPTITYQQKLIQNSLDPKATARWTSTFTTGTNTSISTSEFLAIDIEALIVRVDILITSKIQGDVSFEIWIKELFQRRK
jgi:hypothetical protein